MISPSERFDAFSFNRLIKKEENLAFGANQKLVLSPNKHSLFVFIHLLNRSITNVPWMFWISVVITFIQLAFSSIHPFNEYHWEKVPKMEKANKVFTIIVRYVPFTASTIASSVIFAIFSVLVVMHFVLLIIIVLLIKNKKDVNLLIKIFFFYSYLVWPLLRSSIVCNVSEHVTTIVRDPSFGTFFLSLFSLFILLIQLFMAGFLQFAMGSSPSPNMANPLAIWGPCAWRSVIFELYSALLFIFLEFTRSIKNSTVYGVLTGLFLIISILHLKYQSVNTYYISFEAYEYIGALLISIIIFNFVHILLCIPGVTIPLWLVIFLWFFLPIAGFIVFKIITNIRLHKVINELNECGTKVLPVLAATPNETQEEFDLDTELQASVYDSLNIKSLTKALFVARAACLVNHSTFEDMTLLNYVIDRFPEGLFHFLHLAFLAQNQMQFVDKQIDAFLDHPKNAGILQCCVIYQIIMSIQESSNDLPQYLLRELGKQKLQTMKCRQLLSKFWTSCYKADISQMSRNAFALNKHIKDLHNSWKLLMFRYPFSQPVLKEYISFLSTIGTQHRVVEAIISNHPQFNEMTITTTATEQELSMNILHQAVEDAVDRRPISSIHKLRFSLAISVIIALIFFLFIIILSLVLLSNYFNHNEFIHDSVLYQTAFSDFPNGFDSVIYNPEDNLTYRSELIGISDKIAHSLNEMLRTMPKEILKQFSNQKFPLNIEVDLYNKTEESDFINSLRLSSYFTQCLPFVPVNDTMVSLLIKNLIGTIKVIDSLVTESINYIENDVNLYVKYSPIFYVLDWAFLIIVMFPLLYFSITSLKDEMTYLFSIYLTIPRSMLNKFVEANGITSYGPTSAQQTQKTEKSKGFSSLIGNAYGRNNTTGSNASASQPGLPLFGTQENGNDDKINKEEINVSDTFKMLINDKNSNISVLPKYFVLKVCLIFSVTCGIIALHSTIAYYLFTSFSQSLVQCFYTQKILAGRAIGASLIMHAVASSGKDLTLDQVDQILDFLSRYHTAILFKDSSYNLSKSGLNYDTISKLQTQDSCSNKSDLSCQSLNSLYDMYINQMTMIIGNLKEQIEVDVSSEEFQYVRSLFNDHLSPLLLEIQQEIYSYTDSQIGQFRTNLIIIIIVGLVILILIFIFFLRPITHEAEMTIQSVKLPLKHISPLDIADLQKVLMYLQGESDFKSGSNSEKKSGESQNSNSVLHIMQYPFAIFDNDLSLLFANSAFYSILNTSREVAIGLPLSTIFSVVIPFKDNENHPFHSLLDTVSKLQRGVSSTNIIEIRTELVIHNRTKCPVLMRLVGMDDGSQNNTTKKDDVSQPLVKQYKASSYAMFITDLSRRKALEAKISYETEISQKLIDSTIPKPLMNSLIESDSMKPQKFENIPMVMFSIKSETQEEGLEDEMVIASGLFIRTANDIDQNFANSITRLIQDPPNWFYVIQPNSQMKANQEVEQSNEQKIANLNELIQFVFSVIDVYYASSTTSCTLSAFVHIGSLSIVPLLLKLPTIEVIGSGFQKIKTLGSNVKSEGVYCTQEVEELIQDQKNYIMSKSLEKGCESLFIVKRNDELNQGEDMY